MPHYFHSHWDYDDFIISLIFINFFELTFRQRCHISCQLIAFAIVILMRCMRLKACHIIFWYLLRFRCQIASLSLFSDRLFFDAIFAFFCLLRRFQSHSLISFHASLHSFPPFIFSIFFISLSPFRFRCFHDFRQITDWFSRYCHITPIFMPLYWYYAFSISIFSYFPYFFSAISFRHVFFRHFLRFSLFLCIYAFIFLRWHNSRHCRFSFSLRAYLWEFFLRSFSRFVSAWLSFARAFLLLCMLIDIFSSPLISLFAIVFAAITPPSLSLLYYDFAFDCIEIIPPAAISFIAGCWYFFMYWFFISSMIYWFSISIFFAAAASAFLDISSYYFSFADESFLSSFSDVSSSSFVKLFAIFHAFALFLWFS